MTGAKIENLQALRGVAALLVLLSHVSDMEKKYGGTGGLLPNFENEG
jgi:peptidoglycan/LPS O-acetylase OafA/YrhL